MKVSNKMEKYIRIGEIPENGKSGIYDRAQGAYTKSEEGVSVYDAAFIRGKWHIVMPNPCTETTVDTIHGKLLHQCNKIFDHAEVYLVDGELIGFGSDGEPLLKNANIIEKLGKEYFSYI